MAVISGFFDAILDVSTGQPDRKYSADDFGAIFDGIISDGIFEKYPDSVYDSTTKTWSPFKVVASGNDVNAEYLEVIVNPGRAWLDRTWTLNDSTYPLHLDPRNIANPRIDRIFIKVDKDSRVNSIQILKGDTSHVNPTPKPTPVDPNNRVIYHLIAEVYVGAIQDVGDIQIKSSEIKDYINKPGGTPYVKSNVTDPTITVDTILNNLEKEFDSYQSKYSENFLAWFDSIKDSIGSVTDDQAIQLAEMVAETYSTDYLSGGFPYFNNDCLFLSSSKDVTPPVIINFGYVSGSVKPNKYANKLEVYSGTILSSGG